MEGELSMQETVYGSSGDESHVMTERVRNLAGSVYQEFERMITKYDEDVVKELMPLVVSVLESLDMSCMENQEHEVELELLREDNEQLVTQYEREKQLRKASEQRHFELEYAIEDEKNALQSKVESLESIVRMLELKARNVGDHASRLEDKETEMKKEYTKLHDRYTELFKTHMDYMERSKMLFGSERLESFSSRKGVMGMPSLRSSTAMFSSNASDTPMKSITSPLDFSSLASPNRSTDSNTSLKSELQEVQSPLTSPVLEESGNLMKPDSITLEKAQLTDRVPLSDRSTATKDGWVDGFGADLSEAMDSTPIMEDVEDFSDCGPVPERSTIHREQRRPNTLYQELSFQDSDILGEVDEGADITGGYVHPGEYASSDSDSDTENDSQKAGRGMGKEVENLILENNELLATKNALNIVKDDLIAKVDELTSEHEILRDELKSLHSVKEKLKQKVGELEEELRKSKEDLEKAKANKEDDEGDVPMAQRKRFTRVEMARVLMERNQYKERLMELQEAVRWTEMIRATRNDSSIENKKNRSSIWKFFNNLFGAPERPQRKVPLNNNMNMHYNAPTSHVSPALDQMRRKRLGDRRGFDFLDSDVTSERLQQQRAKERREQYKQVRAHVRKDDGRLQAYGWSLPTKTGLPASTTASSKAVEQSVVKQGSQVPVPVPVYCRPLLEKEPGMKIWCAAGVNFTGGPHPSKKEPTAPKDPGKLSDTEMRNQETKSGDVKDSNDPEQQLSSMVWICTSTHNSSKVTVIDANNPGDILESFPICSSHLLCIASVPGAKASDYKTDEAFKKIACSVAEEQGQDKQQEGEGSEGNDSSGKIGSIIFVSCATSGDSRPSTPSPSQTEENGNQTGPDNTAGAPDSGTSDSTEKMSSALPTMWLGSQSGSLYMHSSVSQWGKCIHSVKLKDSVLSIVHVKGRVFAALADGTVAVFHRAQDGEWDLTNYHVIDLGRPHYSIRCMSVVHSRVWCGYKNRIHVIDPKLLTVEKSFDAHPRKESQVRQLAWAGEGVWVSIRLDSTLRLYHALTHQHLQDVDIEPYVSKMLGTGKLGFSFVRITALLISCNRLWMGTGNGVIISVPLSEHSKSTVSSSSSLVPSSSNQGSGPKAPGGVVRVYANGKDSAVPSSFIPHCSMAQAQLSFHGHRDAVKFFIAVPGQGGVSGVAGVQGDSHSSSNSTDQKGNGKPKFMLVVSGGEGYIDFRIGDGEEEDPEGGGGVGVALPGAAAVVSAIEKKADGSPSKGDRSHLIVWQVAMSS